MSGKRVAAVLLFVLPSVTSGGAAAEPALLSRARLIEAEIEFIRAAMGIPAGGTETWRVSDASWRHAHAQAAILRARAERLAFELTHSRPDRAGSTAGPQDAAKVRATLDAALGALRRAKDALSISTAAASPAEQDSGGAGTPDEVLRRLLQLNGRLDRLLIERFGANETYHELTLAAGHAAELLSAFPAATRLPEPPDREPGKTPSDVYERLLALSERIGMVMQKSGLPRLQIAAMSDPDAPRNPESVHLLASLVRSDLALLQSRLPGTSPVPEIHFPGRKFPSDCHQRAGLLDRQIEQLESFVDKNPAWLNDANAN